MFERLDAAPSLSDRVAQALMDKIDSGELRRSERMPSETVLGQEFGVPLDLAGHTLQTFIRARECYGGEAWSSQVVKLLEDALKTDLRAPGFPAEL